jgi:Rhodopirellula transposase DDE domain/Winged helix-turn helix
VGVEKKEETIVNLTDWILAYVSENTAGSPTDERVKWTHLQGRDIAKHIKETYEVHVSNRQVKRILKQAGYCKRKPVKTLTTGESPYREEQFRIIMLIHSLFVLMPHNPMISIDTKKKEQLGQLTRNEPVLCKDGIAPDVYDHDYSYLATGKAIPHGIYDMKLNKGFITLGNSHETAAFVVDNLKWWWNEYGSMAYPQATTLLVFCDSGGANGHRHHLFKKLLQDLAKEIKLRIVVVHYPPYCSKYNPIERKLFAHVHRTIQGTILTDIQQVKELMSKTSTSTGLTVDVRVVEKDYPIGEFSAAKMINQKRILYHPELPNFSYTIIP